MSVRIIEERRKKSKKLVAQQKHRRQYWWNRTREERVAHLGWCKPCRLHYQSGTKA